MIVAMKKARIIVQQKDSDDTVGVLRGLGVLHVEHKQIPKGEDINTLQDDIALLSEAINILSRPEFLTAGNREEEPGLMENWKVTARHVVDLKNRIEQLQGYGRTLKSRITEWEGWGDFEPEKIQKLAEKNVYIRLYQVPLKEINHLPAGIIVKKLSLNAGMVNCVLISQEKIEIPFKEIALPRTGLEKMRQRLVEDIKIKEELRTELIKVSRLRFAFQQVKRGVERELEFHEAIKGMGEAGAIRYISGYIPFDKVGLLQRKANEEKWGIAISEPSDEDNVPTLIRNPRWVSLINPVFKLLEIIPGYRELDISLPFLIFFSIFFGMLIGDAGYGLTYIVLLTWLRRKMGPRADKAAFSFFYLLSFCAMIWGILTGSFFGQEWLIKAGIKPLLPALNNTKNIQSFCFFLGALHLTIAHSWRAVLKTPSLSAWADMGWVSVLWAAFFFARMLILGEALPSLAKWLLLAGVSLVILFTNPQKNILKTIGEGLGTLALSLMNNFTDVVSYVRLFAVGLAGVAIADTFNNMAASIGNNSIIAILAGVLIVVAGHGLNLVLGPMSVLVHGVRLNVLEFSGHANVSWSGIAYRPLKEK